MSHSPFQFESLFGKAPLEDSEALTDDALIPVQIGEVVIPVTLGMLRSVLGGGGGGGSFNPTWTHLDISALQQPTEPGAPPAATLVPGASYFIVSSPGNQLEVALPADIPMMQPFAIHAKGGPVILNLSSLYIIAGVDEALILADGESVYLLQDVAGHLEIV